MTYLDDGTVTLARGAIDENGAQRYGKTANVPDNYVTDLQTDLHTLGFPPGGADGDFGSATRDALCEFQRAAAQPDRLINGTALQVTPTYGGAAHGSCDALTRREIRLWLDKGYQTAPVSPPLWAGPEAPLQENGIPFAEPVPAVPCWWPILTQEHGGREVAYKGISGRTYGRNSRRFLADRASNGRARYHVGVDLWGKAGDVVVACESGVIINHYHFYHGVHALFVQSDSGTVINYGEVKADSWQEFGLAKGSRVSGGQPIARVGQMVSDAMCHFETYRQGTTANHQYYHGQQPPIALLNPTRYLLHLAAQGQ